LNPLSLKPLILAGTDNNSSTTPSSNKTSSYVTTLLSYPTITAMYLSNDMTQLYFVSIDSSNSHNVYLIQNPTSFLPFPEPTLLFNINSTIYPYLSQPSINSMWVNEANHDIYLPINEKQKVLIKTMKGDLKAEISTTFSDPISVTIGNGYVFIGGSSGNVDAVKLSDAPILTSNQLKTIRMRWDILSLSIMAMMIITFLL